MPILQNLNRRWGPLGQFFWKWFSDESKKIVARKKIYLFSTMFENAKWWSKSQLPGTPLSDCKILHFSKGCFSPFFSSFLKLCHGQCTVFRYPYLTYFSFLFLKGFKKFSRCSRRIDFYQTCPWIWGFQCFIKGCSLCTVWYYHQAPWPIVITPPLGSLIKVITDDWHRRSTKYCGLRPIRAITEYYHYATERGGI